MNKDIDKNSKMLFSRGKVALGLSGGVDSSVAALLLKQAGYDVTGVFMQCWDFKADGCRADEDRDFAVRVAGHLGIRFEQLDFRDQYKSKVIKYFYSEYEKGRTPNPDVMCNREIKFGIFYDWAVKNGFDKVATGHYARVINEQLYAAVDVNKDQSYFLYRIKKELFKNILFPLGDLTKKDVRKLALENALPTATRPESMGICFIGEVAIKEFLKKQIAPKLGVVKDASGNAVGEHDGAWYFTVGQRHGFRLNKYYGHPMYVLHKDVVTNEIIVGAEDAAMVSKMVITDLNWFAPDNTVEFAALVRIRHLGKLHPALVTKQENGDLAVSFKVPVFGVAPGQSAVVYNDDLVIVGGTIV